MLPSDHPEIFGHNFAQRNSLPILMIGKRAYTRYDLGRMGCPHTVSARELDKVLKQLSVNSIEDLVKHYSPEDFVGIKGFGVTAFYVLTCVLRDARINLKSFYSAKVTVDSLKTRVKKAEQRGSASRRAS